MDKKERVLELVSLLNRASDAYYGGKDEIISNYEWDSFFDELFVDSILRLVFVIHKCKNLG